MPVHDWTRVDAGIFHDFHNGWIIALRNSLNSDALPSGYYALSEQHAGKYIADVLTPHADLIPAAAPRMLSPPLPDRARRWLYATSAAIGSWP